MFMKDTEPVIFFSFSNLSGHSIQVTLFPENELGAVLSFYEGTCVTLLLVLP